MCTGCHLAPGMKDTEMRTGLYPKPPNLSGKGAHRSAAQQFWIIKHGLKMTAMPAWGLTHEDERLWSMVAFLQKLPELSAAEYQEMIESGEGHHHEGMEGEEHEHGAEHEHGEHDPGAEREHGQGNAAAGEAHEHAAPPADKLPAAAAAPALAVDRFQSMLAKGDTGEAAELLDPAVLIFESGAAQRSRAEYASHHLEADASFLKTAKVRVLSRAGNAVGDLAWLATESEITSSGAKPVNMVSTETMILKRETPGWRIAHIHWSSRKK
jgi:ketosteroid isomerase-like protein